jgi:predicted GIY-YIG superfamily endonuclease
VARINNIKYYVVKNWSLSSEIVGGKEAKILRKEQAEISTRAVVGDEDLMDAMKDQQTKFTPQERNFLATGLEHREYKSVLSIEPYLKKDIVYCFEFQPNNEMKLKENESLYNFGVTSDIEKRWRQHKADKNFKTTRLDKCFVYPDRATASRAESYFKDTLDQRELRVKYKGKIECFKSSPIELEWIYKQMNTYLIPNETTESTENTTALELKRIDSKNRLLDLFADEKLTYNQLRELIDCI